MKNALVIGASGGIGAAVAAALQGRGVDVIAVSRSRDGLDVTDPSSVDRVLGGLDGPFDLIFVARVHFNLAALTHDERLKDIIPSKAPLLEQSSYF